MKIFCTLVWRPLCLTVINKQNISISLLKHAHTLFSQAEALTHTHCVASSRSCDTLILECHQRKRERGKYFGQSTECLWWWTLNSKEMIGEDSFSPRCEQIHSSFLTPLPQYSSLLFKLLTRLLCCRVFRSEMLRVDLVSLLLPRVVHFWCLWWWLWMCTMVWELVNTHTPFHMKTSHARLWHRHLPSRARTHL